MINLQSVIHSTNAYDDRHELVFWRVQVAIQLTVLEKERGQWEGGSGSQGPGAARRTALGRAGIPTQLRSYK